MSPLILHVDKPGWLGEASRVLDQGDLLVIPTDTVYGIAVDVHNAEAIQKLFHVKGRPTDRAIPVLIGQDADLRKVASDVPAQAEQLMQRFWPGALTLILPRRDDLPAALGPGRTVGVRMPNHPIALELLQHTGPLAVTSANLSGETESRTALEALRGLGDRVQLVLDAGQSPGGMPSTVVEFHANEVRILRQGPISAGDIQRATGG
jgi:L-threonylcarbamoyladenylate synthase